MFPTALESVKAVGLCSRGLEDIGSGGRGAAGDLATAARWGTAYRAALGFGYRGAVGTTMRNGRGGAADTGTEVCSKSTAASRQQRNPVE